MSYCELGLILDGRSKTEQFSTRFSHNFRCLIENSTFRRKLNIQRAYTLNVPATLSFKTAMNHLQHHPNHFLIESQQISDKIVIDPVVHQLSFVMIMKIAIFVM